MILKNIIASMKEAQEIVILPHIAIDGDSLGSSLALGLALKKMKKAVKIYIEEEIPYIYNFLPGREMVEPYKAQNIVYDMAVALDTGDLERLGERAYIFNSAKKTANVDHHNTNTEFAFYNYVDFSASAVGEIVYQMINMMGQSLNKDIATCLYVAVATDTGGFRYSNTTAVTHQIAADLINNGADVADISQRVFDTTTLQKVKLTGNAISSLQLLENGKIAMMVLTDEMMKDAGAKEEDCDGIVNTARNIQGVEVAVLLRQKGNGEIKANLRSKSHVDVSAIAGFFSGGGHKKASGFTTSGKLEDIEKTLLDDIKEVLYKV